MFGYLRFFLALLVLFSHVGIKFYGLNPGVIAVVIFYMLAGHVVAHLWEDIIPSGPGKLLRFYKDRALRIFPLYCYVGFLTLLFLAITGYGEPDFSLPKLLGNLLIVPLNYYMVVDTTILTTPSWCLIPPSWSLGAELQAYLVLPLVLTMKKFRIVLVTTSFCIYMMANFSVIHPEYYGYRLIAGVFFIFAAGSSIRISQRAKESRTGSTRDMSFDSLYPLVLWGVITCFGVFFIWQNSFSPAYTKETFLGVFLGIPLICFLGRNRSKLPWNRLFGSLSYGVFLSHFLMIWLLDYTHWVEKQGLAYIPVIILGSILIAYFGMKFIENPVDNIRK